MMYGEEKKNETISIPPDIVVKAEEGDAIAQLELGNAYFNSIFVEKNCDLAFEWILRSAEQGNLEAQFRLGDIYALGYGAIKSLPDAYKWYTKAAIQGYKKALIRIHNLYQEDIKIHCRGQMNSDEEKWSFDEFKESNKIRELNEYRLEQNKAILNGAIDYYTKQFKYYQSSNQEDPDNQLNLAFLYQHGYGIKKYMKWAFDYYRMAAEQGHIDAQYNLGDFYQKHTDIKFNYRHAFKWYTESAQGGNIAAQRSLAYFYLKGLATDIDHDVALYWYTKAAEAGDSQAQVILAKLYRKGDCIKQDLSLAVKWYSLAAQQGNIVAQNCLSQLHQRGILNNIQLGEDISEYFTEESMNKRLCTKLSLDISKLGVSPKSKQLSKVARRALIGDGHAMYEIGLKYLKGNDGFIQNQESGIKWIKGAANAKNKGAQLMMADLYKKGDSVEQDYFKAAIWYKNLAKQQDANGQCNVGIMYNEGLGVRKDPLEASKWFIWAADQENSDAQYNLAMLRFDGRGLRQDKEEAIKLLFKSARQGNIRACYRFGTFYSFDENNLEEDRNKALELMKFAANHGSIQAQLRMVYLYKKGDGIEKSTRKYVRYLHMATDAGSAEAQYQLALMYLKGDIIDPDYIKAYNLFKQAKDQGFKCAESIFQNPLQYHHEIENYSNIIEMFIAVARSRVDDLNYHIGSIYEYGVRHGTDQYFRKDYAKAKEWYSKASKKGDSRADYRLGFMYENGKGVKKDLTIAINYYQKASEKENSDAAYRLACMYRDGYAVTPNMLYAFIYYMRASEMGHKRATEALLVFEDHKLNELSTFYYSKSKNFSMLEKVTEEGYTRLQYQLGLWYENNNDDSNAFKWFGLAADIGVMNAYYRLGVLNEEGRGTKQGYIMAAKMYQKAAEKEDEEACYRLARLYQYGNGVELDYLKAYHFYKKATDMGHAEAHKVLNITLENNTNSNGKKEERFFNSSSKDYQDSFLMCEYVAEHGDIEVQFKVGYAYEHSVSEPYYVEAHKWYSMAATDSHKEAIYHLGLLYEKGLGVSQNFQIANRFYEQAGHLGSGDAIYRLGNAYHHGNGVEMNPIKAIEYYKLSAKLGNPKYQCELGNLYKGENAQKNLLEALKWYTKAYLQGYDDISSELYSMYRDIPYELFFFEKLFRNLSIASRAYFRLIDIYRIADYSDINNRLGILYFYGYGTYRNLKKAWSYFTKEYSDHSAFSIKEFLTLEHGTISSERCSLLNAFAGDEAVLNQIHKEQLLYELGMIFFDGLGQKKGDHIFIEKDYFRAFNCLKRAAQKNHSEAMIQLGIMYHCGYGVKQDREKGERCFGDAINEEIELTGRIATLYHTRKDIQDFKKAYIWYKNLEIRLDENLGDGDRERISGEVKLSIGLLYEYGDGVKGNHDLSLECYNKLADDNLLIGIHRLALMYYYGKGVSVDYKESFRLFEKSLHATGWGTELPFVYDINNPEGSDFQNKQVYCMMTEREVKAESHYYIGLQYKYGQGVSKRNGISQCHFRKALKKGCKRAKYEIED